MPVERGARRSGSKKALFVAGLSLLPASVLLLVVAFRFPGAVERVYGGWVYPQIARLMGALNDLVPFCLAEAVAGAAILAALAAMGTRWKRERRGRVGVGRLLLAAAAGSWIIAGVMNVLFVSLWGLNYARPSLEQRMQIPAQSVRAEEVLDAGIRCARQASVLHSQLGVSNAEPTRLPMKIPELDRILDRRLADLALPGDAIRRPTSRVKRLFISPLISYLGLSGAFIPFTGEPSMNGLVPDVSAPIVVAHEKAHQRGITNEGEANLVAFLACSRAEGHPYLPYSAHLYAAALLIAEASIDLPEESRAAWQELRPGPRRDLTAIRDFWARYQGALSDAADRVNDAYLRTMRVPEGAESYGEVTRLLVALDRQRQLLRDGR